MKSAILSCLLLFTAAFVGFSQAPEQTRPDNRGVPNSDTKKDETSVAKADNDNPLPSSMADYVRPDSKTRFKRYVNGTFGPVALGKTVAIAGIQTWRNSPEEWGDRWEGFGRRVASGIGKGIIKNTTTYTLDETLKLDSHYYRSKRKDVGSRLTNALISPVTARDE